MSSSEAAAQIWNQLLKDSSSVQILQMHPLEIHMGLKHRKDGTSEQKQTRFDPHSRSEGGSNEELMVHCEKTSEEEEKEA